MQKRIITQTRPSVNVEFWTRDNPAVTQEYLTYFKDTYISTGLLVDFTTTISEDNLTMTNTLVWQSAEVADTWRSDLIIQENFINLMEAYIAANGITSVRSKEDI